MILPMNGSDIGLFCELLLYHRTERFRGIKKVVHGVLLAMVGYDDWAPNSVQMHVWLRDAKALDRTFIRECFRYPYEMGHVGIVIGVTPCNNTRALSLNERLGFRRLLTIKDGYALGTDMAIQELRKEDCRWLKVSHGR